MNDDEMRDFVRRMRRIEEEVQKEKSRKSVKGPAIAGLIMLVIGLVSFVSGMSSTQDIGLSIIGVLIGFVGVIFLLGSLLTIIQNS